MTIALLYGAGSGALHAVTGPDHVLSLGPVALRHPRESFRIGLSWGVGHAIGTLVLALPLLVLSNLVHLPTLATWGQRGAGAALLMAAGWSLWTARTRSAEHNTDSRTPLMVGLLHGMTGAGSLLLVLPVLVSGSLERTVLFLAAFSVGGALAMALLTSVIAKLGAKLEQRVIARFQAVMMGTAAVLGSYWLIG
jgi:hypothetical protein